MCTLQFLVSELVHAFSSWFIQLFGEALYLFSGLKSWPHAYLAKSSLIWQFILTDQIYRRQIFADISHQWLISLLVVNFPLSISQLNTLKESKWHLMFSLCQFYTWHFHSHQHINYLLYMVTWIHSSIYTTYPAGSWVGGGANPSWLQSRGSV